MSRPTLNDGELVVLDQLTAADAEAHLAGEDDEHARRFGWFPLRSTPTTVSDAIDRWQRDWGFDGPTRAFAARVDGQLVGGCELRRCTDSTWNLAYWVFPRYRRMGYAVRITSLAVAFAFDELGAASVELRIDADNIASRGVAAKTGFARAGSTTERAANGVERPMLIYRRIRP